MTWGSPSPRMVLRAFAALVLLTTNFVLVLLILSFSTDSKSSSLRAADNASEAATSGSACEISTLISSSHKSAWLTPGCWEIPCKGAWVVNLATVGAYGQPAHRPFWGPQRQGANLFTVDTPGSRVNLKTQFQKQRWELQSLALRK